MRILVSTIHLGFVGGLESTLAKVIPGLLSRKHEVAILHEWPVDPRKNFLDFNNSSVEKICVFNEGVNQAISRAKKWKPDFIYNQGVSSLVLEKEIVKNWPAFFYCHASHGTCLSGTKFWKFPRPSLCNRPFGMECLWRYGFNRCGGQNIFKTINLYRNARDRLKIAKDYKCVFVASNWMREVFLQNGLDPQKVSLVPLFPFGVVPDQIAPKIREQNNLLLYAGRVIGNKGWRHAIEATGIASDLLKRKMRLIIAGTGPDADKVKSCAAKKNVEIDFKGHLSGSDLNLLRRQADLQLVPSLLGEGFGLVGIEAGCLGLPSAGYPVGGITDWLLPGITGETTSLQDLNSHALGAAIHRALGDSEHWQKLRLGAWAKSKEFTLEKHLDLIEGLFNKYN